MANEKIIRKTVYAGEQPTEAMIKEIEAAASLPPVLDEDVPELTMEQYAQMAEIAGREELRK